MKKIMILTIAVVMGLTIVRDAFAIKYVSGYVRSNGTYVSGHFRDTSNDGYSWNNANYLGLNN